MGPRIWPRVPVGLLTLSASLSLTGCPRQPAAMPPAQAEPAAAGRPFPAALRPHDLACPSSLEYGGHAQAEGYEADGRALEAPVRLVAWRHADSASAQQAWGRMVDALRPSVRSERWLEAEAGGRVWRSARFTDAQGHWWIVSAAAKRPEPAAEAVCLTRASLGLLYPSEVAGAKLAEPARAYDRTTVFGPIDGAAEQYFRYRFVRFHRGEYRREGGGVLVDVYEQASSADAFGVLSAFLGGEPSDVGQQGFVEGLYLVFRQGPYFCRLQGRRVSADLVKEIGARLSDALAVRGPQPDMVALLDGVTPRPESVHFCHEVEDLTPLFYLSTGNVLGLGPDSDCLVARLPGGKHPVTLIVVRLPGERRAKAALSGLLGVALPKAAGVFGGLTVGEWRPGWWAGAAAMKSSGHGWLLSVFDAQSSQECGRLIDAVSERIP